MATTTSRIAIAHLQRFCRDSDGRGDLSVPFFCLKTNWRRPLPRVAMYNGRCKTSRRSKRRSPRIEVYARRRSECDIHIMRRAHISRRAACTRGDRAYPDCDQAPIRFGHLRLRRRHGDDPISMSPPCHHHPRRRRQPGQASGWVRCHAGHRRRGKPHPPDQSPLAR